MSGYRLGHDLDDDPELYARHVLDEVPLVFEANSDAADDRRRNTLACEDCVPARTD